MFDQSIDIDSKSDLESHPRIRGGLRSCLCNFVAASSAQALASQPIWAYRADVGNESAVRARSLGRRCQCNDERRTGDVSPIRRSQNLVAIPSYSVTASISATKRLASLSRNELITSNTASLKPPTLRMSLRS